MSDFKTGQLGKLIFRAYDNERYEGKPTSTYTVLFNPEKVLKSYKAEYEDSQAPGTTATNLRFDRIRPEEFNIDLVFDSTIVGNRAKLPKIGNGGDNLNKETQSVPDQIQEFKKVVIEYNGEVHAPPYVTINWGTFLFKGRLIELNITYTLFSPDGIPIRAKASAKFHGSLDDNYRTKLSGTASPDLTHIRTIQEGDTLPLMTYRIYGDASYYLEVARVNKLNDIRNLKVGDQLIFPPLDKATF